MRRLKNAFVGFLIGGLTGLIIGALGGTMDRGSMMILMPSGPLFWAIVGAFVGCMVGALLGVLLPARSRGVTSLTSKESEPKL